MNRKLYRGHDECLMKYYTAHFVFLIVLGQTPTAKSAADLQAELACAVQVARVAWTGQNWADAKQAFSHALDIIESTSPQVVPRGFIVVLNMEHTSPTACINGLRIWHMLS